MMNDENSKDSRESIYKRSHWAQLEHFWGKWMVDCKSNGLCYMQLISILMELNWILKIMVFGSNPSTDNIINLMFEAQRGRPKDDDWLT